MSRAPILEVRDLQIRFRMVSPLRALTQRIEDPFIDAVAGISFDLRPGETFGLVGESGSGKSTLARALLGLVPVAAGSIRFEGQNLVGLSERAYGPVRRQMAMMFQDPIGSLSPRLSVRSLITEPYRIFGVKGVNPAVEAERLLSMVGLPAEFAQRYPHQLSGGQARRVGVARALALRPRVIIADEPTAGLDVSVQGEILNLLNRLQRELGIAILIITHNLNVVRHVTDRMGIMYLGRFVEEGPTESVFHDPAHPYTEALLSANPEPDPDAQLHRVEIKGDVPSLMNRPDGCEFHTRCPYVKPLCRNYMPGLVPPQDDMDHQRSCHFPLR